MSVPVGLRSINIMLLLSREEEKYCLDDFQKDIKHAAEKNAMVLKLNFKIAH